MSCFIFRIFKRLVGVHFLARVREEVDRSNWRISPLLTRIFRLANLGADLGTGFPARDHLTLLNRIQF